MPDYNEDLQTNRAIQESVLALNAAIQAGRATGLSVTPFLKEDEYGQPKEIAVYVSRLIRS